MTGETNSAFTPREIVSELDRFIVGQNDAKRAVAIALRNRWRRQQLPEELRDEILPKNILMIGPTGVGKTEIARRLARLAQAPFLKVEATKFTEVGYVRATCPPNYPTPGGTPGSSNSSLASHARPRMRTLKSPRTRPACTPKPAHYKRKLGASSKPAVSNSPSP